MDELRKRQKIISQLVEARLEQGISQAELAQGGWESSVPALTAWKVGHRTPRLI